MISLYEEYFSDTSTYRDFLQLCNSMNEAKIKIWYLNIVKIKADKYSEKIIEKLKKTYLSQKHKAE